MDDNSIMPFGKYEGNKLINVPASYLLYIYDLIKPTVPIKRTLNQKNVMAYIEDNMDVLKKEINEKKQFRQASK